MPTFRRRTRRAAPGDAPPDSLAREIAESCDAMARHALATGRPLPEWIVDLLEGLEADDAAAPRSRLPDLVRAHQELTGLVAPASPQALVLLERDRRSGRGGSFGGVRVVRQLLVASGSFLAAFVASVPFTGAGGAGFFGGSGRTLVANQLLLLSAAGVGASLAALFRVDHDLTEGTYDPRRDGTYWVRFLLGLVAGAGVAALLPLDGRMTRALVALAGGFAAPVVHRALSGLAQRLDAIGGPSSAEPPHVAPSAAVAAVKKSTEEGDTAAVVAAIAPGAGEPPPAAPAGEIPPELEGSYRARILIDGVHAGAVRVVDGPALTRAGLRKLAAVARAAAVLKLESAVPFGEVVSASGIGEGGDDLTVVLEDGVAAGPLHEWASATHPTPRAVVVELYDEEGRHSSTLKLKDARVEDRLLEDDPGAPGFYRVRRLVLAPKEADWLVGAFEPLAEAAGLFGEPAAAAAAAPPPVAPCRGSFARGVAAGLALALVLAAVVVAREVRPGFDTAGDETPLPPECPSAAPPGVRPSACVLPTLVTATPTSPPPVPPSPTVSPTPTPTPTPTPVPPSESPTPPSISPSPPPYSPTPPPYSPSPPPYSPSPPPPHSPSPPVHSPSPDPSESPRPPTPPPTVVPPTPPPPPPTPTPTLRPGWGRVRCKQPPDAVVRSVAHSRHPGCAKWHSKAEPPGHLKGIVAPAPQRVTSPAVRPAAAPVPLEKTPAPAPRRKPDRAPAPAPPPTSNEPAVPPGLAKKGGLPPGLQKKGRSKPK